MLFNRKPSPNLISHQEAQEIMKTQDVIVLDVRTEQEYKTGHIRNAVNLEIRQLPRQIQNLVPDTNQKILVYCLSGARSRLATKALLKMGYSNVSDFGSFNGWPEPLVTE